MKLFSFFFRENSSIYFGDERKMVEEDMQDTSRATLGEDPASVQTVLIVEDDADIGDALKGILQDATPYEVLHVSDGFAALKLVRTLIPQLVLLDYLMPSMDGLECLDKLRESKGMQQTPVILMSATPPTSTPDNDHQKPEQGNPSRILDSIRLSGLL
jgi:CheY-like chemotaxis protein